MWISYPEVPLRDGYDTGLVIMVHNRESYVRKMFASMARSHLDDVLIIIIDDASDDPETLQIIEHYSIPGVPIIKLFKSKHKTFNIHENLRECWDMLSAKYRCRHLAVLDSDMVVKPEWLDTIRNLHKQVESSYAGIVVSGFDTCAHRWLEKRPNYKIKRSMGGACMFFKTSLYQDKIRPCLKPHWDWGVVQQFRDLPYALIVACPSVVQHIGAKGLFGKNYWIHDFSLNYSLGSAIRLFPAFVFLKFYGIFYNCRSKWRAKFGASEGQQP